MFKKRKIIIFIIISVLLVMAYFSGIALKDDIQEVEKVFLSTVNEPLTRIAHIEVLDETTALVFYEWGPVESEYFGTGVLKKNIFGWKLLRSSSSQTPDEYKMGWNLLNLSVQNLGYTDLLFGKVFDSEITDVKIVTKNGEYEADINEYNNGKRFWYFITNGIKLESSTVKGISHDGKIIQQIPR